MHPCMQESKEFCHPKSLRLGTKAPGNEARDLERATRINLEPGPNNWIMLDSPIYIVPPYFLTYHEVHPSWFFLISWIRVV